MTVSQQASDYHVPAHVPAQLVVDFDIYHAPEILDDVQRGYERLFHDAPDIFWTPRNGGHWIVKGYDTISKVVTDPETFTAADKQIPRIDNPPRLIPLTLDPPENVPFRQALMPTFSPKSVNQMEGKIRGWARKIVDDVAGRGECDFIYDVSALFPVTIFMELMGLPLDKLREFRELVDEFFCATDGEQFQVLTERIIGIFSVLYEERLKAPKDDLITQLMNCKIGDRPITRDELMSMCHLLFLGGMDTVTNVTGFAYRHLAQDPALQKRLVEDPSLIPKFVEEGLRLFGVVNTPRGVTHDCEKMGVNFRKGEMVVCILPTAGRDDRKNANPNRFDIDRPTISHLTFSTGQHLCVGHFLARMEMRVLTEEWLKRIPHFSLKQGIAQTSRLGTVLSLVNLPIEWSVG